jgi:uncharacterized protein YdiU (UPF0061 family)
MLDLMQAGGSDFTNTFRALATDRARDEIADREGYDAWHARWQARIETEPDPVAVMRGANPAIIPRNHRIEDMIAAAVAGDDAPFHRLNAAFARPYDDPQDTELTRAPQPDERVTATFCGT